MRIIVLVFSVKQNIFDFFVAFLGLKIRFGLLGFKERQRNKDI
jgi:hypothetical protein